MTNYRVEKDLLGELKLPRAAYYGINSLRASQNFAVSGYGVNKHLLRALAEVKLAAAQANLQASLLPAETARAICSAAQEVAEGGLAEQFIVDALQGGAGTSTNMNMNEVLANRAIELLGGQKGDYDLVHPLNKVNLSQSTNDTYPTALRIAAIRLVLDLSEALAELQTSLQEKEAQFAGILKLGRTELQDALPITLGQEFGAFAEAIARDRWRLYKVEERLRQINLGGTAIGTGLNAPRRYIYQVVEELRQITGLGLARAENMVDLTQNADIFAEVSGLVKAAAVNLCKIAGDLMLLAAGPAGGLAEINLPPRQAGSSIMPGKVNPVILEAVIQVSWQVMGADQTICQACAGGRLELNAFLPLIAHNLLHVLEMLAKTARVLNSECIRGITANEERCRRWLEESNVLVTALVPYIGYEQATSLAQQAREENKTIVELVQARNLLTIEECQIIAAPRELTRPGIAGARQLANRFKKANSQGDGKNARDT
ncbi:fumarate lyase [Desulfofarcimen acetoxidans DSM 771]|uniref:Fumarate lyase n=1 Tax=Desulfofarcimen acetoxidans (strain ATCC 49208 / DSM 771 / KCTC 5769 / VKM B-1644 / 5575) TaxID=485916 RepID=C8W2Y3_DESAS|nr:aspartate ammonia-lyase [Desulfofarcimen acetoxidans]ACV61139.1 fumarate lyase [Desulfofarcimen acetoxidans DSM 771]